MQVNNLSNLNSQYQMQLQKKELERRQKEMASGLYINSAADDAAGLAISEKMRAEITGYSQASNNVSDGINLINTSDGALSGVSDMLTRINELSVQASNGIYSDDDRAFMQKEVDALISEIERVAQSTNFNGINLLNGDSIDLQVGTDSSDSSTVTVPTNGLSAVLESLQNFDITTAASARETISLSRDAIDTVSSERGTLGALSNTLEHTSNNLSYMEENLQRAESEIRDTDYAKSASAANLASVRYQTATLMLDQMESTASLTASAINLMV